MSDNRGISSLGLCHSAYPVRDLKVAFTNAKIVRFRWLDLFFNPKNSTNAETMMRIRRPKVATVHIINGPGMNNNRVQPHEITAGESPASLIARIHRKDPEFMGKFIARLLHVRAVADKALPGTLEFYVCPWLERHEIPKEIFDALANEVRKVFLTRTYFKGIVDSCVSDLFLTDTQMNDTVTPQEQELLTLMEQTLKQLILENMPGAMNVQVSVTFGDSETTETEGQQVGYHHHPGVDGLPRVSSESTDALSPPTLLQSNRNSTPET